MFLVLLTVSLGMRAAINVYSTSETIGGVQYNGYGIYDWENEGEIAALLAGTYSGTVNWNGASLDALKLAELIKIGGNSDGEPLGNTDLQSLNKLTACKYLDMDKATLANGATASNIQTGSNILTVTLPADLTKDDVNAVAAKLKTYNSDFHSVISTGMDVETEEVETYFIADQNGNATSEEYTGQRFNDDTQGTVQRPVSFNVTRLDDLTEIEYSWTNPATNQKEVLTDWNETTYNDNNGKYTPANLTKSVTKQTNNNNGCYGYYDADGKFYDPWTWGITTEEVDGTTKYYLNGVELTRCTEAIWTYTENGTTYVVSSNDVTNITPNQYNQNEGTLSVPNTEGVSFDVNRKYTYTYKYYDDYDETYYTYTSEDPNETTKTVQKTFYVNIVKGTKEVTSSENRAIAYVNTAGTLYEATVLAEAKNGNGATNPITEIVLSGNLGLGDLANAGQAADPLNNYYSSGIYREGTYTETVDDNHSAWSWGNLFTSIDLSGVENIDNYRYLRLIGNYNQTLEELILSPNIEHLPERMLYSSQKLKNLVIPEGVTTIGRYAFQEGHMEYVSIPSTIQMIGTGAFDKCKQLYYLDFAEGIEHLNFESGVFTECEGLKHVALPEGLLNIGDEVFLRCTGLRSVRLPSTLLEIGDGAFALCSKLTSITIPKSVVEIGQGAFPDDLKDVYLMATSIAELPKIWTAGAVSAGDAIQNGNSTFGAANLVNNNTNNHQGASALSGMTWDEACDDYYATNKMAALHFPNDFNRDELEDAFRVSLTQTYGRVTSDNIKVPDLNHGWVNGTESYDAPENCSDLDVRIQAAEPDPTDPSLSVLSKTGWRQFALIKGYAKDGTEHELEKYYKQVWYTMCFPFNLTDELLTDAFGAGFNICEFSGVTADYVVNDEGENESTLILHFTQSTSDQETGYLADAFHPYMIHPNYKSRDVTKVYSALFHDIYPIAVDEGTNNPQSHSVTKTVEVDVNGETKTGTYTFIGNVGPKTIIPYGAYFLGTAPGDTYPKYWRETSETNNAWSQYAAIVLADEAFERALFGIEPGENWVKSFNFIMDGYESPDGEALSIDNVIADAKEKNIPVKYMNIVYDFNGQIVRKGDASLENLPTGMYIVNGKKYLVK